MLLPQQHPPPPQRLAHRPGVVGHHRHPELHRLLEGNTEPLVLGETQKDVGLSVVGVELVVVDLPSEDDLVQPQLADQLP